MIRNNGGIVYTMENDLYDLSKMKEADTFVLDGMKYGINSGKITLVGAVKL
jgi:hypothetical protein